jgi:hypothetical protein
MGADALTPATAESKGQPVEFNDVVDRQTDDLVDQGLPSEFVERLAVTPDHSPRGRGDILRRSVAVRFEDEMVAVDFDLDFGPNFPPDLPEDGLIEGQPSRVSYPAEALCEGHWSLLSTLML